MKNYTMLPIQRPPGWKPTILKNIRPAGRGSQMIKTCYKVLSIDAKKKTAEITDSRIKKMVSVARFGNGLLVGDIIGYDPLDTAFERPVITHRYHQKQTHPKHLQ